MIKDIIQVIVATVGALSIAAAEINTYLTTVSLLLAIGYTVYKFLKEK